MAKYDFIRNLEVTSNRFVQYNFYAYYYYIIFDSSLLELISNLVAKVDKDTI